MAASYRFCNSEFTIMWSHMLRTPNMISSMITVDRHSMFNPIVDIGCGELYGIPYIDVGFQLWLIVFVDYSAFRLHTIYYSFSEINL